MSLDAVGGRRIVSPSGSDRSSPIPRATRREDESGLYKNDKNIRRYAVNIERALAFWEISPEEWADYIAFLGRLLKAIQTYPKDPLVLPHSGEISTRLAQCLNPTLPSGVHQKALEVYAYVFSTFGDHYISAHLYEFLPGLSSVLSFASLSVRPGLYALFEDHVVGLPTPDLRPALKSIILSLLPALEEESGEDFERAFGIVQTLQSRFVALDQEDGPSHEPGGYFWQCLFLAVITSPSKRQGALNYLSRSLPPLGPKPSITDRPGETPALSHAAECVVSPEPGLLIRCFVCGLSDTQILVQRGFLDLLVATLPLSATVLQGRAGADDLDRLVAAATQVLLRKDMGLNRRLWTWFLGPETKEQNGTSQAVSPLSEKKLPQANGDSQLRYFSAFGKASLERCILALLQGQNNTPAVKARPFRLCLSLMDRWEIGGLLVPQLFLPAMRSLYEFSLHASEAAVTEVIRSASLFFDGVEASLIWERMLHVLQDSLAGQKTTHQSLRLFMWMIKSFNIKDEEMLTLHIPLALSFLLTAVNDTDLPPNTRLEILDASAYLLSLLPGQLFQAARPAVNGHTDAQLGSQRTDREIQAMVLDYYPTREQPGSRNGLNIDAASVIPLICDRAISALRSALSNRDADVFAKSAALLLAVLSKTEVSTFHAVPALNDSLMKVLLVFPGPTDVLPFPILGSVISLLVAMSALDSRSHPLLEENTSPLEPVLTPQIWKYLSPSLPKYHVEAAKALWQLHDLFSVDNALTISLADLVGGTPGLHSSSPACRQETVRRFTVLWGHSMSPSNSGGARRGSALSARSDTEQVSRYQRVLEQPLMILLDVLNHPADAAYDVIRSWLHSLTTLDKVFYILFQHLSETLARMATSADMVRKLDRQRHQESQLLELDYLLGHIQNLLTLGNQWTWRSLEKTIIPQGEDGEERPGSTFLLDLSARHLFSKPESSRPLDSRFLSLLELLLSGPLAARLTSPELESTLIDRLMTCLAGNSSDLQSKMLRLVALSVKLRTADAPADHNHEPHSRDSVSLKRPSTMVSGTPVNMTNLALQHNPPPQLFKSLEVGFTSSRARHHLNQWLEFLVEILPVFADALLANLLPLAECLCLELLKAHEELAILASEREVRSVIAPESVAMSLLEGLEMVLDRAYQCLIDETSSDTTSKPVEPSSSFLSNVASGVFKIDGPPSRMTTGNSRLTVILAFQDAVRVALGMWLWASRSSEQRNIDMASSATTAYNALKVRNKTRHLLEQIFAVELLEGLEVVVMQWCNAKEDGEGRAVLSLLHVMQVSRPKNVVPAILDAMCSRTNPSALPSSRLSSQTVQLSASDVATFFSAYIDSTEDDAMDELWPDCISFLRDVLANPMPYRQVTPHLLSVVLLLAEKLNNTNFGEQRKMRRDLGDLFLRLLTATFTTLPSGYITEAASQGAQTNGNSTLRHEVLELRMSLLPVLNRVFARLDLILDTPERVASATNAVSASLFSPIFRAKSFPRNVNVDLLSLLALTAQKAPTAKPWKKDVADALNDPKLLASTPEMTTQGWFPVLRLWTLHDQERMPELLSRLAPPSTAGIMFGVGASAARLEADRKTQLNLRRVCLLLLSSPADSFAIHLRTIGEKLAELFDASPSSSPSTTIKAELFMLCRALALSFSTVHLSLLWPIVNDKLRSALMSLPSSPPSHDLNNLSLLQACKLLDMLIALSPDEFQLHEWLYITDTIDAVYRPADWSHTALADELAEVLGSDASSDGLVPTISTANPPTGQRGPLLETLAVDKGDVKALPREEFTMVVLKPFFSQLSIHAYEGVYSMDVPDSAVLRENLLVDLLDISTIVE